MTDSLARLTEIAQQEVSEIMDSLPGPLQDAAAMICFTYDDKPAADLIASGIAPDVLGLFLGSTWAEHECGIPVAPGIFLFVENLWAASGRHLCTFKEEVRTTFLHELGHFLGLDEEEVAARGLE